MDDKHYMINRGRQTTDDRRQTTQLLSSVVRRLSSVVPLRTMRILIGLGGAMLTFAPARAFAHDNLGGDELAATGWMLIAAVAVLLMGVFAGIWAFKNGQFSNVEEIANRMVEMSEDYDAIMAEADERERAASGKQAVAALGSRK